jgi:hypothetical protein
MFFIIEQSGYMFQHMYLGTISFPSTSWRHRWGCGGTAQLILNLSIHLLLHPWIKSTWYPFRRLDGLQRREKSPSPMVPDFKFGGFFRMRVLGSSVGIATGYGVDGPRIESRWGARFFAHVQTGPGAHPVSCTMDTGGKATGACADHPPLSSADVTNE